MSPYREPATRGDAEPPIEKQLRIRTKHSYHAEGCSGDNALAVEWGDENTVVTLCMTSEHSTNWYRISLREKPLADLIRVLQHAQEQIEKAGREIEARTGMKLPR